MTFQSTIRYWNPERQGGLAVIDIPPDQIEQLGGLKQARVRGTINGQEFQSNVMPAGGGRLAMSVSKAIMKAAGASIGDEVSLTVERA